MTEKKSEISYMYEGSTTVPYDDSQEAEDIPERCCGTCVKGLPLATMSDGRVVNTCEEKGLMYDTDLCDNYEPIPDYVINIKTGVWELKK